jgi:hypothetical protein
MTLTPRLRVWLVGILLLAATTAARTQPISGNGVILNPSPMYLSPDPTRVPLTTLPAGVQVRVLAREGDWLRVVFRDRYLGDRTGYVLAANVRIESVAAPPSLPTPAPPVPGLVQPATAAPPPRPAPAPAPVRNEREHGYVWLSGTFQNESTAFTTTTSTTQNGATATVTTEYEGVQPVVADVAIGKHLWNGLGFQLAGTWASQITDANVAATVPLPVPGAPLRSVAGRTSGINRQELAVHIDASYAIPITKSLAQVVVFAGPSWFRVKQGLVTGVVVNDAPPFESITVVESTKQRLGYNAGIEASVRIYKALGIGGLVRYSKAELPFSPAPGLDITVTAGGVQAGGGLHFRF